ncbi:hypothetical protein LZ32DRAFT_650873 [Colletotrichum eremochloae]|nr:hypothetical protein LZ32DRAFT_650873 [Colletotrichum eremochloae]
MVSLTDFPAELLGQIFRGLPQADLASLCKTQSTLRKAAVPLLYENIHFRWAEKNTPPPIIQFLKSILISPDLALHIRHLKLLGDTFWWSWRSPTPKIPVDTDSISPLISAIKSLCLPYESFWVEQLHAGSMDAFIALLFTRVPKLRSLHMDANFTQDARLFSNVLRSALYDHDGAGLPVFKNIHTVVFRGSYDRSSVVQSSTTENALPLFYLPALRKLEVFVDTPKSGAIEWPISPPRLSNLTTLELHMLRETSLEQVLRATPCLKSLTWHCIYKARMRSQGRWALIVNLDMVASALSHVKDTLENLQITAFVDEEYDRIIYESMEFRGDLRSLSTFHLKTLRMPWCFFMGFSMDRGLQLGHMVPKSVENLIVSENFSMIPENEWKEIEIIERLLEFLGSLRRSEAQLRSLHLVSNDDEGFEWVTDGWTKRLSDACSEQDVEFRKVEH